MFLLALFCINFFATTLTPLPPHNDRYNQKKRTIPEKSTEQKRQLPQDETDAPEFSDEYFADDFADFSLDLEESPHTPLGTICIEITEYCSYFIMHCMDGPLLSKQKEALIVFCDVLKLLTNLADSDCAIIRLDSYISNIIHIIQALENASKYDDAIMLHRAQFPLISSLHSAGAESDSAFLIHNALRAPSTAKPLITELFLELKSYTHHKLHAILDRFKQDTQQLLALTNHDENELPTAPAAPTAEQKSLEGLGWLCRHAAHTCSDLTHTVSSSTLHTYTGVLMGQIQQMLSAMALTYNHLGANKVRSGDRSSLATRYAHMLEQLSHTPRRGSQSLLTYTSALPSIHEKEIFIATLFSTPRESDLFLSEFFPAFSDALEYNLEQFCTTLTEQVTATFSRRYWLCE